MSHSIGSAQRTRADARVSADSQESANGLPRKANAHVAVENALEPNKGCPMVRTQEVDSVEEQVSVYEHLRVVQQIEHLTNVADVHLEPDGRRLHTVSSSPGRGRQASAYQAIHSLTNAEPLFPAFLLNNRCYIIIQGDRRTHALTIAS